MGFYKPNGYRRFGIAAVLALALCQGSAELPISQPAFGQTTSDAWREDATTLDILGAQNQFEKIADKLSPSVVAVSASEVPGSAKAAVAPDDMTPATLHTALSHGVRTVGTGFVVDSQGYILTNDHVVAHAKQIWITTDGGKVYPAVVVGSDALLDVALLKTTAPDLIPVQFASNEPIQRGMWSIALGNPYGLATGGQMSMAVGVVSAVNRTLSKLSDDEHRMYSELIQTTAEINPGNSGGPLIDIHGWVIGINVAVVLPEKDTNGIGFAIAADHRLMHVIQQLKEGNRITYGYLGISLTNPSDGARHRAGVDRPVGSEIVGIVPGSPAASSALRTGDIITSVDGQTVRDTDQLAWLITDSTVGEPANLTVFRQGTMSVVSIRPGARPVNMIAQTDEAPRLRINGMLVSAVPANWGEQGGAIVLAVAPDSPAARQGMQPGAIITGVAGKIISNLQEFQEIVRATPADRCAFQTTDSLNQPTGQTERVAAASASTK